MNRTVDFSERVIVIKSDDCTLFGNGRAHFVLPTPIVIPSGFVAMIQLIKVTYPLSFYTVNQFNDKLTVAGTTHTLTHGAYNAATLLLHLRALLALTVEYYPERFKFSFSDSVPFSIGADSTCLSILGFTNAQCGVDATTHTGAHVANLHPAGSIKLISNFNVNSLDSGKGDDNHLLARIPIEEHTHDTSTWKYATHIPAHKYRKLISDNAISEVVVALLDERDRAIEFNGVGYIVKLGVSVVQKNVFKQVKSNASRLRPPNEYAREDDREAPGRSNAPGAGITPAPRTRRRKARRPRKKGGKSS